jgi:hypothetical protein
MKVHIKHNFSLAGAIALTFIPTGHRVQEGIITSFLEGREAEKVFILAIKGEHT